MAEIVDPADVDATKDEVSEVIRGQFVDLYPKFAETLSPACFSSLFDILAADGVSVKEDVLIEEFKKRLVQHLQKDFSKMWQAQGISQSLAILEVLKNRYKDVETPQWRPAGKSPEEQTIQQRVRALQKKISFLEKQLEFQKTELEKVIPEIEDGRKLLDEMELRRNTLLAKMAAAMRKFKQLNAHVKETQQKANESVKRSTVL